MNREEIIRFLKGHKDDFENNFGVLKIGLFGSYARNAARDDSDIDIAVELKTPDMFSLIGIKQTLEEQTGRRVEVIRIRNAMNTGLKKRIERDVIYV
jgi:predicted nucleotidyltransferase